MTQEIRGTLLMKYVETAREPAETIGNIQIFNTQGYYDWYIQPYPDFNGRTVSEVSDAEKLQPPEPIRLEKGDLLTVFNTVTKGDVIFDKELDMVRNWEKSSYNDETTLTIKQWRSMFIWELPAYVEKKEDALRKTPAFNAFGHLEAFYEQGMEGIAMSFHEYNRKGYDGLHALNNGDRLVVYSNVSEGNMQFEEQLDFNGNGPFQDPVDRFYSYNRVPLNIDPETFIMAFAHRMPAVVRRSTPKP